MLSSFQVQDFRCFKDIKLDQLARINLIGGKNNTGKTTLLEALFLSLGANNPELLIRVSIFRGVQQFKIDEAALFEGPWKWLFRTREPDCNIKIIETDDHHQTRELQILFEQSKAHVLGTERPRSDEIISTSANSNNIAGNRIILRQIIDGENYDSKLFINARDEFEVERSTESLRSRGVYITPYVMTKTDAESAERFSRAEKENRQDHLVKALQSIEPRLKRLTLLFEGGQPAIFGDIGIGELIPLNYMGAGLSRLLYILLAIIDAPNGRVLIDEIENGLHYSVLVDVWKAIQQISKDLNVQIFATTHSLECIRASHQALQESNDYALKYYRLERKEDNFRAVSYDHETMMTSIDMDFEMR